MKYHPYTFVQIGIVWLIGGSLLLFTSATLGPGAAMVLVEWTGIVTAAFFANFLLGAVVVAFHPDDTLHDRIDRATDPGDGYKDLLTCFLMMLTYNLWPLIIVMNWRYNQEGDDNA